MNVGSLTVGPVYINLGADYRLACLTNTRPRDYGTRCSVKRYRREDQEMIQKFLKWWNSPTKTQCCLYEDICNDCDKWGWLDHYDAEIDRKSRRKESEISGPKMCLTRRYTSQTPSPPKLAGCCDEKPGGCFLSRQPREARGKRGSITGRRWWYSEAYQ